jgi:hypothetical protein
MNESAKDSVTLPDDRWLHHYVLQLRTPDTRSIQELGRRRRPHQPDSHLPRPVSTISVGEKRLLDGIDGHRTIRDILESTQLVSSEASPLELASAFFERP